MADKTEPPKLRVVENKVIDINNWAGFDDVIVVRVPKENPPKNGMSIRYPDYVDQEAAGKVLLLAALHLLGLTGEEETEG